LFSEVCIKLGVLCIKQYPRSAFQFQKFGDSCATVDIETWSIFAAIYLLGSCFLLVFVSSNFTEVKVIAITCGDSVEWSITLRSKTF